MARGLLVANTWQVVIRYQLSMLPVRVKTSGTSVYPRMMSIVDSPLEDRLFCWTQGSGLCHRVLLLVIHVQPQNHNFH